MSDLRDIQAVEPPATETTVTSTIVLKPDSHAPSVARQYVEDHSDHLPAELIADAQLLVSEIVTNALRHGRGAITLRVRLDEPRLGIAVTDEGPGVPTQRDPGIEEASGRGLLIVDAVARAWGVDSVPGADGKTVWFDI